MHRRARPRALDVAASAVVHLVPAGLERHVEQLRLDARSLIDGLTGARAQPFSTHESPPVRPIALRDIDPIREILPGPFGRRYEVLARDLRTVLRELRGDRLPAVVDRKRPPSPLGAERSSASRRTLSVAAITRETADALSIELRDPTGAAITFAPGQFLTLFVTVDGTERKRAYSISSAPSDGRSVTITVKRIPGGIVSGHLHGALRVGDTLVAAGPSGSFVAPATSAPRHFVLFAGGSGITPILSILRTTLRAEPGSRVTLVYGNRDATDVIFAAALLELASAHADRCRVVHLLEQPSARDPMPARRGRPDHATVRDLVAELALDTRLSGEDAALFFVCGPAMMMDAVRTALVEAGVGAARIREERFLSPPDPHRATPSAPLPLTPQRVSVKRRGVLRTFVVAPGQTILDAAASAGADLPSSCTMGGCAACRCRVVEGDVSVDEPNCLSAAERDAGYVLTCVGRPRTDVTLELP
jgi:ring-1,2-phenylacetyl-CoA epoxidase subunit PaaE